MAKKKIHSQSNVVIQHLLNHGSITSMEAFRDYGITRLSAIIFNLRREGYDIDSKMCHSINRQGNSCSYSEYTVR